MKKTKKIKIMAVSMILLICMLATGIFAVKSNADLKNGTKIGGNAYINVTSKSIYAETSANSSGIYDSDFVYVASDVGSKVNVGKTFTTAYVTADGSFSGIYIAYGEIKRGDYYHSGSTSATVN